MSNRQLAIVVGIVVAAADQLSKAWAVNALTDGPIVVIPGVLQFRITFNTGASFSILSNQGPILAVVAIGVIITIMVVLGDASRRIEAVALGLVLGGSLGNLLDRVFRGDGWFNGAVVDFIDVGVFTNNIADIALFVGVGLLLFAAFIHRS
ncbi:MAG: signal peptidase II [Actinomycetia bacterium]|nr:signal peptidase II [Actinomycetes bacterium]